MKKGFILLLLIFFTTLERATACEICGCGVGNIYIGILPQFKNHFVGLRYHFNKFNTRLNDDATQYSKDFYQTAELWTGWNIGKRFQVLAIVPFNFNHQQSDEGISDLKGLGDVVVIGNYKVIDDSKVCSKGRQILQQLWIGGGLKFATGKFDVEQNDPDLASMANIQLGSGSTDILLNIMHNLKVGKIGFTTQASYKVSTINKDEFRFGNRFTASSFVSYTINWDNTIINPNIGLLYENTAASQLQTTKVDLTGGSLLQVAPGIEFGFNKISVGINAQLPVAQNFAENQTKQKLKGMAHISFAF